jgi:pimeloyl-ACP methyl ester carboxylesterase
LVNELKPQIDATYRTLTDPDNTGAMGSSMGGLISVWLGWWYNDTFRKIGGLSSAFWRCDTLKNELAQAPHRPIRVYIDSGTSGDFSNCTPCYDGVALTMDARDNLIKNGYVFNNDLDHTIGYGNDHCEYWWDRRVPRALTCLFPTSDEANTVLDTASPPRITNFQLAGPSNVVTWTSYRLRTYALEGSTNETFSSSMAWSNLWTMLPESRRWDYPSAGATNTFRYLRVRELAVPNWPN